MTDQTELLPMVLAGLDEAWRRLSDRLEGIDQLEYRWAPVAGCWDLQPDGDTWRVEAEFDPEPVPAPVSTIAWRMWHLAASCFSNYTSPMLGEWPLPVSGREWFADIGPARQVLDDAYQVFRERMVALGEQGMRGKLGPDFGPYAEDTWADLVIHAMDELAHHGAEIGLLRDLYLRTGPVRLDSTD